MLTRKKHLNSKFQLLCVGSKCITSPEKLKKQNVSRRFISFPLHPENKNLSLTFFFIACGRDLFLIFLQDNKNMRS